MLIELEFITENKLKLLIDTNYWVIDNDLKDYIVHRQRAMNKCHSFVRLMYLLAKQAVHLCCKNTCLEQEMYTTFSKLKYYSCLPRINLD